jgi:hypothetical protein
MLPLEEKELEADREEEEPIDVLPPSVSVVE